ncbi:hypothetical protein [Metapseudomonas furukawaii]|uniref:hypothetical protein n=1 Tax=Metapseudomonas furukawaii TaxID=1149133 RepID=UPI001E45A553|nr:hypothetical protein [Pseudomonas furukawaii]
MDYPDYSEILWYHPHGENYDAHIEISQEHLFTGITDKGDTVIRVCKLDQAETLTTRFTERAEVRISQATNLNSALSQLALDVVGMICGRQDALDALKNSFHIDNDSAELMLTEQIAYHATDNIEHLLKSRQLTANFLERNALDGNAVAAIIERETNQ